jgi:subtilisin family serine protease
MQAYDQATAPAQPDGGAQPSDELRIGVTFKRADGGDGPTKFGARLSTVSVGAFEPDPMQADLALAELARRGFKVTARGALTASVRGSRKQFEALFGTRLAAFKYDAAEPAQFESFYFPADDAPWNPDPAIAALLDDAYIQWPHIYMGRRPARRSAAMNAVPPSPTPPPIGYHHLDVPKGVADRINATPAHLAGFTGRGVRVAMIDSGFAHSHPYFAAHNYQASIVLAPGATSRATDLNGHGTGESANVFAVAPDVTFIGIKLDNDEDPRRGASMLEGLQEARRHAPHIISVSLGYDLRAPGNRPMPTLPGSLVAIEAEVQAAVAAGITVVFSAGNGHYGQMPELISAGGVYVDAQGAARASDYASAFPSAIYSGRTVPDLAGLVGMMPHANYIALPISPGCEIDRDGAAHDGTAADDGWGVFSGTSAAAPQLAGVCALLLQANPSLTPAEIKAVLRRTARDVTTGRASRASDPAGHGIAAGPGEDGATGAGLVDAWAGVQQVR